MTQVICHPTDNPQPLEASEIEAQLGRVSWSHIEALYLISGKSYANSALLEGDTRTWFEEAHRVLTESIGIGEVGNRQKRDGKVFYFDTPQNWIQWAHKHHLLHKCWIPHVELEATPGTPLGVIFQEEADTEHWLAMDSWESHEAACLSQDVDPRFDSVKRYELAQDIEDVQRLLERTGPFKNAKRVTPKNVRKFLRERNFGLPAWWETISAPRSKYAPIVEVVGEYLLAVLEEEQRTKNWRNALEAFKRKREITALDLDIGRTLPDSLLGLQYVAYETGGKFAFHVMHSGSDTITDYADTVQLKEYIEEHSNRRRVPSKSQFEQEFRERVAHGLALWVATHRKNLPSTRWTEPNMKKVLMEELRLLNERFEKLQQKPWSVDRAKRALRDPPVTSDPRIRQAKTGDMPEFTLKSGQPW